jgi:hypothetical protein
MTNKIDKEREHRIDYEIIVDCYDEYEQILGWHCYLEENLTFPFLAECSSNREISPLKQGERVTVIGMVPQEDDESEIFVRINFLDRKFGIPLSQITPIQSDAKTSEAVGDWKYWKGV